MYGALMEDYVFCELCMCNIFWVLRIAKWRNTKSIFLFWYPEVRLLMVTLSCQKKLSKKQKKPSLILFEDVYRWCPKKSASVAQWAAGGGKRKVSRYVRHPPPQKKKRDPKKEKDGTAQKMFFLLIPTATTPVFPHFFPLLQQRNDTPGGGATMGVLLGPSSSAGCLEKSSATQWVFFGGADHQQHQKSHNMQSSA